MHPIRDARNPKSSEFAEPEPENRIDGSGVREMRPSLGGAVSTIVETGMLQKAENLQRQEKNKHRNDIRDVKYRLLPCQLH